MLEKILNEAKRICDKKGTHRVGFYRVVVQYNMVTVYDDNPDWVAKIIIGKGQVTVAHAPHIILSVLQSIP